MDRPQLDPEPGTSGQWAWWRGSRYTLLLAVLVLNMLIAPGLLTLQTEARPYLGERIQLGFFTALVLAGMLSARRRFTRRLALVAGVPTLATSWLETFVRSQALEIATLVLQTVFLTLLVVLVVRRVFRERIITHDVISASLCAYLFIGLAWASVYALIELWQPGSFSLPDDGFGAFAGKDVDAAVRRVYFSFVTLVTLGYGDMVPTGSIARLSAVVEAFVGQIFLVVLVARLVGINVGQAMMGPPPSDE